MTLIERTVLWITTVTPHVTGIIIKSLKLQLGHKARAIQAVEDWNQNSKLGFKFEVSSSIYCGLIGTVSNFWEFIRVKSDLTPKRKFVPYDLFATLAWLV
jgi:hypothetical protein